MEESLQFRCSFTCWVSLGKFPAAQQTEQNSSCPFALFFSHSRRTEASRAHPPGGHLEHQGARSRPRQGGAELPTQPQPGVGDRAEAGTLLALGVCRTAAAQLERALTFLPEKVRESAKCIMEAWEEQSL